MSELKLGNKNIGGDVLSAIDFALTHLKEHCGYKKYNKRLFLFTNGEGKSTLKPGSKQHQDAIRRIENLVLENNIKVNIIPIDFMETYDYEKN
jgi:hypothetical protein